MNRKFTSSAGFLIVANIIPLIGVLFWNWNLIDILFLYWAESAIIGFFGILKVLFAKFEDHGWILILIVFTRLLGGIFFTIHFGGFMAGHGIFLYAIAYEFLNKQIHPLDLLSITWIALATLFISHSYSFVANYLIKGERKIEKGSDPIIEPYRRIFVMHLTLIFGMFPVILLGQPVFLLLVFIILKTGFDLWGHLKERRRFTP